MRFLAKGSNGDDEEAEEDTEVGEPEVSRMNAVELMTIVGSKGLSADHVIVLGFDNRNMSHLSHEAFYVALTRARQSLHLVTGLGCGGSEEAHEYLNLLPEESLEFCRHSKGEGRIQLEGKREFAEYIGKVQFARKRAK
jgi:superfamily I DNA/RNA helicase